MFDYGLFSIVENGEWLYIVDFVNEIVVNLEVGNFVCDYVIIEFVDGIIVEIFICVVVLM